MPEGPQGKIAVITGASSGIGAATAREFAARKAPLFLTARRTDRLEAVAADCRKLGSPRVELFAVDLVQPGSGARVVEEAVRRFGTLDILVCNAGYGIFAPTWKVDPGQMERIWRVNYQSGYESIHAALPLFMNKKSGHLFLVSSVVGKRALPFSAAYCATKFAQAGLAEALAFELVDTGVHVTAVCPGMTGTEFFNASEKDPAMVMPMRMESSQDPAVVARGIADCVEWPKREIRFTASGRFMVAVNGVAPCVMDLVARKMARATRKASRF